MKNWRLYWNTIRHLRTQQLVYQTINRLRSKPSLTIEAVPPATTFLAFAAPDKPQSLTGQTFTFLNQSVSFPTEVDWNYANNGKLWQYNLNYFDFLNQPGLDVEQGIGLIRQFMRQSVELNGGLDPYPVSLRIINWIRFLSHHQLRLADIDVHLRAQVRLLQSRLEYHLLGNHLLENGFALLLGSLYFQDRSLYQKAISLVRSQLTEQLLRDGGHYERSPMYHQIILDRLLDTCQALKKDDWHTDRDADGLLLEQARRMLDWLVTITFSNGAIPLMNDAADEMAPTTAQLRAKAERIGINPQRTSLSDSGFRHFLTPMYEVVANIGTVGPAHQPGHAHADTFSFELHAHGQPVLVDSGTSTYAVNARRQWERSTAAHNTVQLFDADSSEVWGGFRVGRRATVTLLEETPALIRAHHDGYQHLGVSHERQWVMAPNQLAIIDRINDGPTAVARFYLAPGVRPLTVNANRMRFSWGNMEWQNAVKISQKAVQVARQFNQLQPTLVIEVQFKKTVRTIITCVE
ncbi:heparinase II/III family protein [Larkinella humicola]|uniref:Heparinase n=1 Tax=Larkinella humicola TaxID=2607654 RepID=A0A5N1J9X3_9BACT|nr:heparinase II/III family protein [Larkinella humicola]KAA9349467.1 heparinase [Larkinella humicola]